MRPPTLEGVKAQASASAAAVSAQSRLLRVGKAAEVYFSVYAANHILHIYHFAGWGGGGSVEGLLLGFNNNNNSNAITYKQALLMARHCSKCCGCESVFILTILEVDISTMSLVLQMRKLKQESLGNAPKVVQLGRAPESVLSQNKKRTRAVPPSLLSLRFSFPVRFISFDSSSRQNARPQRMLFAFKTVTMGQQSVISKSH